jgi:O-antigen/teichoic acid export membrane protein
MLFKSITQVLSYSLVVKAFGALVTLVTIRMMTQEQYAAYTLAVAIVSVLTGTMVSAFNRIFIVGYSHFRIGENLGAFFAVQMLLLLVVGVLISPLMQQTNSLYALAILVALALCTSEFVRTYYQRILAFDRFSQVALAKSMFFFIAVLGLVAIYNTQIQASHVLLAQVGTTLVVSVPLILRRRMLKGWSKLRPALQMGKAVMAGSYRYLFGYLLILAFFSQIDVFMLKLLSTDYNLAAYGSAFRYYGFLLIGLDAVKAVYLPLIQRAESKSEIVKIFRQHRFLMSGVSLVALVGLFASGLVIPWMDGGKYPDAVVVFRILALSALFSFAFSPYVTIVMKLEGFSFLLVMVALAFVVNGGTNHLLIPTYGAAGAAVTTLISYGILNFSVFVYSRYLTQQLPEHLPAYVAPVPQSVDTLEVEYTES